MSRMDSRTGIRAKTLVLGTLPVSALIAADLEAEGFMAELAENGGPVASPGDPHGLVRLRERLGRFVADAGDPPSTYAHCVHPGVSPWASRPELSMIGQELGLNVICPPVRAVSLFGNKLNMLLEAEKAGIPNLVLAYDPIYSVREVEETISRSSKRFPFILKSARGAGAFGISVIHQLEDFERKLPLWLEQLRKNMGEVILFAERYLEGARHITVPFARMQNGRTRCFALTDSSLQCRFRKIVEFAPAMGLDPEVEARLRKWTETFAAQCGYVGVGTLEFLVDGSRAFLVGGLARLNHGYRTWERVSGVKAVSLQIAALGELPPRGPLGELFQNNGFEGRDSENGLPADSLTETRKKKPALAATPPAAALSLRIYSEDPLLQLPQPGRIHELSDKIAWKVPGAEGVLHFAVAASQDIGPSADGLIGMLHVTAGDRRQALAVARGALEETWIAGSLQTNERFLSDLLLHPWVREGMFHAGFVDEDFVPELRPEPEIMTLFASVCASIATAGTKDGSSARFAVGDQWVKPSTVELPWVSPPVEWTLGPLSTAPGARGLSGALGVGDGRSLRVCAYPTLPDRWQVRIGNWVLVVRRVEVPAGGAARDRKRGSRKLMSLVSGRVHAMLFMEGASVPAHEVLVVVESQCVLVPHALPADARILRWKVTAEQFIQAGQELAEFELVTAPET